MKSMCALHAHFEKRSIHSMTAYRILCICVENNCKYCYHIKRDRDIKNSGPIVPLTTTRVRGNFAVKACWQCIREEQNRFSEHCPKVACCFALTTLINKVEYDSSTERFRVNAWYEEHRDVLYPIWNHTRVLAYPTGARWLMESGNGGFTPVAREMDGDVRSLDRSEIMYSRPEYNSFDAQGGPIVTAEHLPAMVRHLKNTNLDSINDRIDHYIDNVIRNESSVESYRPFLQCYNNIVNDALERENERKENIIARKNVLRYKKINLAMESVHRIIDEITCQRVFTWSDGVGLPPDDSFFNIEVLKMQRILLLYKEIPYLNGKWYLTYDTGFPRLNKTIHSILGTQLASPKPLTNTQAEQYAHALYTSCHHLIDMNEVPGLWSDDRRSTIATTFDNQYRRPYEPTQRTPAFLPWEDTSANRMP